MAAPAVQKKNRNKIPVCFPRSVDYEPAQPLAESQPTVTELPMSFPPAADTSPCKVAEGIVEARCSAEADAGGSVSADSWDSWWGAQSWEQRRSEPWRNTVQEGGVGENSWHAYPSKTSGYGAWNEHAVWSPSAMPPTKWNETPPMAASTPLWSKPSLSDEQRPLVLVLGMPKTGTTSLGQALQSAGFTSIHWAKDAGKDPSADKRMVQTGVGADQRLVAMLMERAVSEGLAPLAHLPASVDAVAEMNCIFWQDKAQGIAKGLFPQMSMLENLVSHYPHAHFILNVRDTRKWVESVNDHNDMRRRLECAPLYGLPAGVGRKDEELIDWVEQHHQRVKSILEHRGAKLLVFDIDTHGADELSAFLGRQVVWGKHNATWRPS